MLHMMAAGVLGEEAGAREGAERIFFFPFVWVIRPIGPFKNEIFAFFYIKAPPLSYFTLRPPTSLSL